MFEDTIHERSLKLQLSLTYPDLLKQRKFTDHKINKRKSLALENLYRQRM